MIETHKDGTLPTKLISAKNDIVFVFGSNLAGIHGAGAAKEAFDHWDAEWGIGVGLTGHAYAIPTKNKHINSLSLKLITPHIKDFVIYSRINDDKLFWLTRIGCGLAGYEDYTIAPLFRGIANNVNIPEQWHKYLIK